MCIRDRINAALPFEWGDRQRRTREWHSSGKMKDIVFALTHPPILGSADMNTHHDLIEDLLSAECQYLYHMNCGTDGFIELITRAPEILKVHGLAIVPRSPLQNYTGWEWRDDWFQMADESSLIGIPRGYSVDDSADIEFGLRCEDDQRKIGLDAIYHRIGGMTRLILMQREHLFWALSVPNAADLIASMRLDRDPLDHCIARIIRHCYAHHAGIT